MKKALNRLILPASLLAVWLLLNNSVSPGHIVLGTFLAITLTWALGASQLRPVRAHPKRPRVIIKLIGHVIYDIARSCIAVGTIIIRGDKANAHADFLRIPLKMKDPHGLAALSCIVSYTPGTVWAEYSDTESMLTLHVLDLKSEEEWLDIIQQRYEKPLMEIFE